MLQDKYRGRDSQSFSIQVWLESMGPCLITPCAQNTEAMQSTMVRMVRSRDPEDRVVKRRGRETASSGEIDAYAMEDYRTYCWKNGYSVLGEISEALG